MTDIDLMGHGHIIMGIIWLLVVGLGISLVATLFPKRADKTDDTPNGTEDDQGGSVMQILMRRYARGEITEEQFRQMRHGLEQSRSHRNRIE